MTLPYRSNTRQCTTCVIPVEEDHLYSFQGEPICDGCFLRQHRPLPALEPAADLASCEPSLGRKALWLHAMGNTGWLGVGLGSVGLGMVARSPTHWGWGGGLLLLVACAALRSATTQAQQQFR